MRLSWWMATLSFGALCIGGCSGQVDKGDDGKGANDEDEVTGDEDGSSVVDSPERPKAGKDPGTVAIHRLNALEYDNTVRDLLGTTRKPSEDFTVQDKPAFGFDNNANALDIDQANLESYAKVAEGLAADVLKDAEMRAKVFSCDPAKEGDACAKTILSEFARRAFRRPVEDAEVAGLMGLVKTARDQGDSHDVGIGLAIQAILSSPKFLYRIELDPDPTSLTPHPVSSYEMASRLSYLLWSSMPDDELFAAADKDRLRDADDLVAQVERMLMDEKAQAFLDSFGAQWVPTRLFMNHEVDRTVFKTWTEELRADMVAETRLMLADVIAGEIGFQTFMNADYTYATDRLAKHYGLAEPGSQAPTRVPVSEADHRQGFLTHGSFLAATSQPAVTSIVRRGRFVFEDLLCGEVAEPPPGVPALDRGAAGSPREKLERHRADPECNACHKYIDPPGFALENYDASGAYRTKDGDEPIDPVGEIAMEEGIAKVADALEMGRLIATSEGYASCISKSLFAFALGRGPDESDGAGDMDDAVLFDLREHLKESDWKFRDVINALVKSEPFRKRRANLGAQGVQP